MTQKVEHEQKTNCQTDITSRRLDMPRLRNTNFPDLITVLGPPSFCFPLFLNGQLDSVYCDDTFLKRLLSTLCKKTTSHQYARRAYVD